MLWLFLNSIVTLFITGNIPRIIDDILYFHKTEVQPKLTFTENYVMDVAYTDNNELYFIEINSWGREYASGSGLYHWLNDDSILYGNGSNTYFRYVTK
jgi:hypothetical protein